MRAFHFTGKTLRDGRPIPPVGKVLRHRGEVEICASGLHASEFVIDALRYAPGLYLHVVRCGRPVQSHDDKFVCRQRTILSSRQLTADQMARAAIEFACFTFWLYGLYSDDLLNALAAIDRKDFVAAEAAARAARAAARAAAIDAADAANAAAYAAAYAAADAANAAAHAAANAAARAVNAVVNAAARAAYAAADAAIRGALELRARQIFGVE